jgi:hypothetical protein
MRAWLGVVVVLASGCDALIGIEDAFLLPDAAQGPDAQLPQAAAPMLSPAPGNGQPCRPVMITNSTPNGFIHVATDGSTATTASPLYTGPIVVGQTINISAMVEAVGYLDSAAVGGTYVVMPGALPPPTLSPSSVFVDNDPMVTLGSAAVHQATCYTLDGSAPSCGSGYCGSDRVCDPSSQTYAGHPFTVTTGSTSMVTVRAVTCTPLSQDPSMEATASYTFRAAAPVLAPASGSTSSVAMSTNTMGGLVCYTLDTSDPDCNGGSCGGASAPYTPGSPITVSGTTTVKAIACKLNYQKSTIVTGSYN